MRLRPRLWCAFSFATLLTEQAAGQVCISPEAVCQDSTAVVVRNAATATCEVTIPFNVLVASLPNIPLPGKILGFIGRSINAEVPLNYTGLLPVNYQAQPVPGCPGVSGDSYSLISDRDHLINARLVKHGQQLGTDGISWVDPPGLAENATWMDTVGLTYRDDTVEIQSLPDGSIKVLANARPVEVQSNVDAAKTLPSNMTVRYMTTHVKDGSLWGIAGEWTVPVVTVTTNRYVIEVAIPTNHRQRLDLTARLTIFPDGTAPAQEGLLGRTIEAMIGTASASQDLLSQKLQGDILQEWSKERDSMKKSPTIEARLRRNYRVTNLWSKDSGRSAHGRNYRDIRFLAHATDRAKVSLEMQPFQASSMEIEEGFGLPVTCQTPCSFTNNGAAQGEPHFTGFDGSLFDFQGQPESHYSLLTDQEHNVNGQFVKRGQRLSDNGEEWMDLPTLEDKATWLGSVGIIYKGDTVDIQRLDDADHTVQVHVNGQEMNLELEASLPSGMNVTYSNTTVSDGTLWFKPGEWSLPQLNIKTPRYEFVVSSPPNHSRRLDLTSRVIVQPDGTINPAEGVLGRTITAMINGVWDSEEMDHIRHSATLEAMLSSDYTVSNLWADDARKSKFNSGEPSKPIAAWVSGFEHQEGKPAVEASRRRALNEIDPVPVNYVAAGTSFYAGVINK
ncbi:hypothetical protein WJX84_008539 [Apatococcus fuscideae]|uniref:Uncharacterized protein n=1 Tax=Apatococcus fuscideae TaxID=2026836 RepID=A0AAW1T2I4_9CHLO